MLFLSIIIPHYNAHKNDIYRCLNSIYSQELEENEFEVIIVDDCSSNKEYLKQLQEYKYNGLTPQNYNIIYHTENKRQGGARNTGVEKAKGEYIQYIDQDDYFEEKSLKKLISIIRNNNDIEIIMMDYLNFDIKKNKKIGPFYFKNNNQLFKGTDFLKNNQVPWVPWAYCYRKSFLLRNNIAFEEKVRFEDVDYVLKATILAKSIVYNNHIKINHIISADQTTNIGNDINKITDLVKMFFRVRLLGEEYVKKYSDYAQIIISHHQYAYNDHLKRFLWRLPPKYFLQLIKNYPPYLPSNFNLLNFTAKNPKAYIYTSFIFKPLFFLLRNIFVKFRIN